MAFSPLYAFRESGVYIDPGMYALAEVNELKKKHGLPAVELMIRLLGYGSPLNPYDSEADRLSRALSDTNEANKAILKRPLTPAIAADPLYKAAARRFDQEKFDPAWEEFIVVRDKRIEIIRALRDTPASTTILVAPPKKKPSTPAQRRQKAEKFVMGDEKAFDDEDGEAAAVEKYDQMAEKVVSNNKQISEMTKTLQLLDLRYAELERKLFKHISGGSQQRVSDFRSRLAY